MVRGLYTSYTGMLNQQYRLDTITNNLANASTTGYKREGATSISFDDVLTYKVKDSSVSYINQYIGDMNLGVKIGENYIDYSQGSFKETENTYDLALEGNGFFTIRFTNKNGEDVIKYTRDGSFITDAEGTLRTKDGDYVLNSAGTEISIPTDASDILIDELGNIYADEEYIDTLGITDFEDYNYLAKDTGENYYIAVDGATETEWNGKVAQGYLEMSNINVVSEMVEMIAISRAYESNQKAIQTVDTMLEKSVNQVGRLA
ncbi:MAG: flagellar hook-basal body protein [Lachnospiraceae bacterium]|nr:flagellar hook-basal body protein [Lachnospiraceae bacterium]